MDLTPKSQGTEPSVGAAADEKAQKVAGPNPWRSFAGIWRENPDFEAFLQEIENLRRERDAAETQS